MSPFSVTVLTAFPELFPGPLGCSLIGDALARELWTLKVVALREFGLGRHRSIDDSSYGGGPGMVIRPDVVDAALTAAIGSLEDPRIVYLSPRGIPLSVSHLRTWSTDRRPLVLLCGRFEGVDQRVLDVWDVEEISIGDFVVCGGELPAMLLIEGCVRLLDGVLGNTESLEEESFSQPLLEYPQYTRPCVWKGREVPSVLRSGHHAAVKAWRHQKAVQLTRERRPDLIAKRGE